MMTPCRKVVQVAPRPDVRAVLRALLVLAMLSAPAAAVAGGPDRTGTPEPPIVAFLSLPDDPMSGHLQGELLSVSPPDRRGYVEIVLRDPEENEHSVIWRGARRRPPLVLGRVYTVDVEHHVSPVAASSIVIRDEEGLVFAAVSDARPGLTVLKSGIPGFSVRLIESEGKSRPALEVSRAGESLRVAAGGSLRLEDYDVVCLSAGEAPDRAPGTGPVSWIIVRNNLDSEGGNYAGAP